MKNSFLQIIPPRGLHKLDHTLHQARSVPITRCIRVPELCLELVVKVFRSFLDIRRQRVIVRCHHYQRNILPGRDPKVPQNWKRRHRGLIIISKWWAALWTLPRTQLSMGDLIDFVFQLFVFHRKSNVQF